MSDERLKFLVSGCSSLLAGASRLELFEEAIARQEACMGADGQLCVVTGEFTGRAADDKYIVDNVPDDVVDFDLAGKRLSIEAFNVLESRVQAYLTDRRIYIVDFFAGSLRCRVVTEFAWQALFISNLFKAEQYPFPPGTKVDLTIVAVPGCTSGGPHAGFRSNAAIACNLAEGLFLIMGTGYAGEIKKSVFTYSSYVLPLNGQLPMHSSVTADPQRKNSAVFFGLSGTGKTSLSAESTDTTRRLVGDDEHVWTDHGIHNIEAGCYAKAINLTTQKEPGIYAACTSFMTVLENVMLDPLRRPDFASNKLTENTRAAYPLTYVEKALLFDPTRQHVEHPDNIIMLTCDAYGILPSVSKLSIDAAIYHFLSGYTAKVAGTEAGIKEPKATFSRCFGSPFMPLKSRMYADLLRKKLEQHQPDIWLVNTGWVGGPYGTGQRIDINVTRTIIDEILSGVMDRHVFKHVDGLNLEVPVEVPYAVPTWSNTEAYFAARDRLIGLFEKNAQEVMQGVPEAVLAAGPRSV